MVRWTLRCSRLQRVRYCSKSVLVARGTSIAKPDASTVMATEVLQVSTMMKVLLRSTVTKILLGSTKVQLEGTAKNVPPKSTVTKVLLKSTATKVLLESMVTKVLLESTATKGLQVNTVMRVLQVCTVMVALLENETMVVLLPSMVETPGRRAGTERICVQHNENIIMSVVVRLSIGERVYGYFLRVVEGNLSENTFIET